MVILTEEMSSQMECLSSGPSSPVSPSPIDPLYHHRLQVIYLTTVFIFYRLISDSNSIEDARNGSSSSSYH